MAGVDMFVRNLVVLGASYGVSVSNDNELLRVSGGRFGLAAKAEPRW